MKIKELKKQVKVEITLDMEYTEDFDNQEEYDIELQGVIEDLTDITDELVKQIYSVKFKNQTTKISFVE